MKKAGFLIALLLIVAFVAIGLFACNDKQTETTDPQELPSLGFLADENGIALSYEGDLSFYYSVDGGEETLVLPGFYFDFSETVGEHTVTAYAADATGQKVAEGTFRYRTAEMTLSDLTVNEKTVSWTALAKTVSVKEGDEGSYVPTTENTYTAKQGGVTVRVKAEGGFDLVNRVYYLGNSILKSAEIVPDTTTALAAPKIKITDKTITWNKVLNAEGYAVSYDGGKFVSASSATVSDVIGAHTIKVKALGDGVYYGDSKASTLEYETLASILEVSKVASDRAHLYTDFGVCSVSQDGKRFSALSSEEYASDRTAVVFFRAEGGFDKEEKKNYLPSEVVAVSLLSAATSSFEAGKDASLWHVSESSHNTWTTSDMAVTAGEDYLGDSALSFNARNNNVSYRFSRNYTLSDAYDHLSFLYHGDGVSHVTLSFNKSEEDFSVSYDLGVLPDYWVRLTVRFDEEGWTAGDMTLRALWAKKFSDITSDRPASLPTAVMDAYSLSELPAYFDTISFTLCGNAPSGASTSHLLSDLVFAFDEARDAQISQPLYDLGSAYVAFEIVANDVENELMLFLDEEGVFRLYSTKLTDNFALTGNYRLYEGNETLLIEDPDSGFSALFAFRKNGRSLVVLSSEGSIAAHFPQGSVFEKAADFDLTFDDDNPANAMKGWSAYTFATESEEWNALQTLPIAASSHSASGVLDFSCGKDLIVKIVYNAAGDMIGLANYFSIDLGNCKDGADDVNLKIVAMDENGSEFYLKGSASAYWALSAGDDLVTYEQTLPSKIRFRSLCIIAEYRGANPAAVISFDNVKAEYHADPSLFSEYSAPEIEKGAYSLSFAHTEKATIEYSVNWSEEWIEGNIYLIPTEPGVYTVRARAVIEANGAVSQIATYSFTVEKVFISPITVTIDGEEQTATWTTNGVQSIRIDEKGESGYLLGEYQSYSPYYYATRKNVILNVRAEGYFDDEENVYYMGASEVSKKIIVDAVLSAPVILPTEQAITWSDVDDANAYAVSVNGGEEIVRRADKPEDRTLLFAVYEGTYTVRVRAVVLDDDEDVVYYGNFSAPYTYSVKYVALSRPVVEKDTAKWTSDAYKVFVSDNGGAYTEVVDGKYTVTEIGGHNLLIKATPGFSLSESVYYYAEEPLVWDAQIEVKNLATPSLLLNDDKNGLHWAYLNDEKEIARTSLDERSAYPFLSYRLSVNDGEWFTPSSDAYAFPAEAGSYSVRVMAVGNGANYRDSDVSEAFSFEVVPLRLSEIAVSKGEKGVTPSTASYDYDALSVERKIGTIGVDFKVPPEDEKTSFSTSETKYLTIRVSGGWDEHNSIYYAGEPIVRSANVIVPEQLRSPELTFVYVQNNVSEIRWNKVSNATKYRIFVNGVKQAETANLYYTCSTLFGDYEVEILSFTDLNGDAHEEYPDSDASLMTYHVKPLAVEDISIHGRTISWTYTGKLYLRVGETGEWQAWTASEYLNESENEETIYLEVRVGYDEIKEGKEYSVYRLGDKPTSGNQVVKSFELLAPKPTRNGNTLEWPVNQNATYYAYTLLELNATEEEIAAAEEDLASWDHIATDYAKFVFDKTLHNNKLLLLKSIGNGENITDSPTSAFGLRQIYLTVDDSHCKEGYITWEKSGITKIQTITTPNGMITYSSFEVTDKTECRPESSLKIRLDCSPGYDEKAGVWYFGDQIVTEEISIIVPRPLAAPVVRMKTDGVYIESVANSDCFKVKVNGGEEKEYLSNNRLISFEGAAGDYVLSVYASNTKEEKREQYPDSAITEFSYSVKSISLSDIEDDWGVARFTAVGLLSVKEGEAQDESVEWQDITGSSYSPADPTVLTMVLTVRVRVGTDVPNAVYYIGDEEEKVKTTTIVVPHPLAAPVLTQGVTQISISDVQYASGYLVQIDDGEEKLQSGRAIAYPTDAGDHVVKVRAVADDKRQHPNSVVTQVSLTTRAVSLSDVTVSGATFSWSSTAYKVTITLTINNKKEQPRDWTESSYTVTSEGTTQIAVDAFSGYLASEGVYYACSDPKGYLEKTKSVTITKLAKPSLSVSNNKIKWAAVSGANGYEVKVNSASYVTQSSTEKALSNQEGKYKVYVRAKGDGSTVLSSDSATIEYTVKNVTLSDITVNGTTASWSAVAYKTYLSTTGSYSETTATSFTPTNEGTYNIKVKAEGGWNNSSNIYYYTSKAIEKTATIKLYKLAAPSLTTNSKGVTWAAVSNATTYSVRIDGGSFKTQKDCNVNFSTSSGVHTVEVKAVGSSTSGYQDSSVASFTYETKQTSLTLLTSTTTMATWLAVGLKSQYSTDGTNFVDTKYSGYTATASGEVSFRAVGGYDSSAKTFYNGTSEVKKKTFSLPGMTIGGSFEKGTGNWTREVFNGTTNDWDSTTATSVTSVADSYGAGSAIMLKSYMNGMSYRFGFNFGDMPASYKSLSFDIKLNEYPTNNPNQDFTSLRFQDSASKTYVDYKLNNLSLTPGVWYHVTIFFEDSNLIVNSGNKEYTAPKAKSLLGKDAFYDKLKALDQMYITVKGSVSNGPQAYTYIDNFVFSTSAASTDKTRITDREIDFNDGTVNANYTASGWKSYKYGNNAYEENPNVMKIETGAKTLSLYCGGTTSKATYNVGGSNLGEYNHFQINIGTEATSVSYSIELITASGSSLYVAGGENYRASLSNTSGASNMKTLVFNFETTKIKSIIIYASESTGNGHFYMDNIVFTKLS